MNVKECAGCNMPKFGTTSLERLETCCIELQNICHALIKVYDVTVIEGARDEQTQNYYFETGASKLRYPESMHNLTEERPYSLAVDLAPWPIDWHSKHGLRRFDVMAGHVLGIAAMLEYRVRWGGDWNSNNIYDDQSFHDRPHFEFRGYL